MAVGSNYYTGNWTKTISAPYWPQAPQTMGITPMPDRDWERDREHARRLGLRDVGPQREPERRLEADQHHGERANSIDAANWAGWVTPNRDYWTAPAFTKFAPQQLLFAQILPHSTLTPSSSNYSIWVQGMGNATGSAREQPEHERERAVNTLSSYVSNQLGSGALVKLPDADAVDQQHGHNRSQRSRDPRR